MRRTAWTAAGLAAVALLVAPADGSAQRGGGDGWWDWAGEAVVTGRRDGGPSARGAGPPFCRKGQGHPVHGRQWCRDKGFGGGVLRWEERAWGDVILRSPRGADPRRGTMDRGGLIDVLGDIVLGRVTDEGRRVGAREPLTGRWLTTPTGASVLQIRAGGVPIAELTDLTGNGRADLVLVPGR